jgi:hypothetical protein
MAERTEGQNAATKSSIRKIIAWPADPQESLGTERENPSVNENTKPIHERGTCSRAGNPFAAGAWPRAGARTERVSRTLNSRAGRKNADGRAALLAREHRTEKRRPAGKKIRRQITSSHRAPGKIDFCPSTALLQRILGRNSVWAMRCCMKILGRESNSTNEESKSQLKPLRSPPDVKIGYFYWESKWLQLIHVGYCPLLLF